MAGEILADWPKEDIPDEDTLYMRIHSMWFDEDGKIIPKAFQNHGSGMSTNWSKYATAEQTQDEVARYGKNPEDNAVGAFVVGNVREIPEQSVEYTPMPDNRAHTDVLDEKDNEVRVLLRRECKLVIRLQD